MDENRTPTLKMHLTSNETWNRNLRRIDDAYAAKLAAQPLPKTPIDVFGSTPTIGLARTGNADLNYNLNLIDANFSAVQPLNPQPRGTSSELMNRNLAKVFSVLAHVTVTDSANYDTWVAAAGNIGPTFLDVPAVTDTLYISNGPNWVNIVWANVKAGDRIQIQSADGLTIWQEWIVTGPFVVQSPGGHIPVHGNFFANPGTPPIPVRVVWTT